MDANFDTVLALRDLFEYPNAAFGVLVRSASHVNDMQAATSHVQRGEATEAEVGMVEKSKTQMKKKSEEGLVKPQKKEKKQKKREWWKQKVEIHIFSAVSNGLE